MKYKKWTLEQKLEILSVSDEIGIVDRGYKGKKNINGTKIILPSVPKKDRTAYQNQKARKQFRARAGIEPIIGHIKHNHRMLRNY